jgi:hypothetical protein
MAVGFWSFVPIFGDPGEAGSGGLRAGEESRLAGKLVGDGSLLWHALGMGAENELPLPTSH